MSNLKLFLGFLPDDFFQKELQKANPYFVSMMIGKKEYLQTVIHEEKQYLGKFFEVNPTLDQIQDTQKHLLSLLQTLAPHYAFKDNPPKLVTIIEGI